MGTDVIMYAEKHDGKEWNIIQSVIWEDRCYYLFDILAGLRNLGGDIISYPRGIPKDVGLEINQLYLKYGGNYTHDASHLTLAKMLSYDWSKIDKEILIDSRIPDFIAHVVCNLVKESCGDFNSVRIVFWFDS